MKRVTWYYFVPKVLYIPKFSSPAAAAVVRISSIIGLRTDDPDRCVVIQVQRRVPNGVAAPLAAHRRPESSGKERRSSAGHLPILPFAGAAGFVGRSFPHPRLPHHASIGISRSLHIEHYHQAAGEDSKQYCPPVPIDRRQKQFFEK